MKKIMKFSALLCAMMFLATACTREEVEPNFTPALDGSEIQFGARAGFENANPETRTVYSGEIYTSSGKTFERIDWVNNDLVEIYCPEAKGLKSAQYVVTSQKVDDVVGGNDVYDEGYLSKLNEDAGALQWNGDGTHTFYAMYPSSKTLNGAVSLGKSDGNYYINGVITNEQHSQGAKATTNADGDITHYELMPDMRFAYMAAVGSGSRLDKDAQGNPKGITLNFVPIVTAIRVELTLPTSGTVKDENGNTVTINSTATPLISVRLTGKDLVGDFTANLSNMTTGYPAIVNGTAADDQSITMLVQGPDGLPITLQPGQSIAFTFFVRPGAYVNLKDLTVSFSSDGLNFKSRGLKATASVSSIAPMKKTSLLGIKLPVQRSAFNYANWMEQVRDDAKIQGLSLPGTGGSFSYAYNGSNPAWYKQQTLPVFGDANTPNQWDLGIRAFEMACDRPQGSTVDSPGSLDGQQVRVNKQNMNITVGDALRALLNKVSGSDETAMAIITYQSEGTPYGGIFSRSTNTRNAKIFAKSLLALYTTLESEFPGKMILYTPNTVMYDEEDPANSARGKLMIVCRINQRGEVETNDSSANNYNTSDKSLEYAAANWESAKTDFADVPILLIDGCGTAKDRWDARGYQVSADGVSYNTAATMLNAAPNAGTDVEYYMVQSSGAFPNWNVQATEGGQYSYTTSVPDQLIWYQEWARVVDLEYIADQGGSVQGDFYVRTSSPIVRWRESYKEKVADAKHSFDLAIGGQKKDHVFINSLCGYLVDPDIADSYIMFGPANTGTYRWSGGTAGNIEELAKRINPEFGAYVMSIISAQGDRGATGVVMMDRLSSDPNDGASNYMPSILIQNNLYTGMFKGSETPEEPETPVTPPDTPGPGDEEEGM